MDDSAENSHVEGGGGGSGTGTPDAPTQSVAQGAATSGSEAPPTGGTPAATAQPQGFSDGIDYRQRYSDTKSAYDKANVENKELRARLEAYQQQHGELPDPNEQAPPLETPWSYLNQPQQPNQTPPGLAAQMENLAPHWQGVVNAIDEAFLAGNATRGFQIAQAYGLLGSQQQASAQPPQQGLTPEQVQEMINAGIRQSVERAQQVDDAITRETEHWGPEFMRGEIEVNGVKTTRERALMRLMEQTGSTDAFAILTRLDPQGVQARISERAIADFVAQQQAAAQAGQLPSVASAVPPQQPSNALTKSVEAMGLPTKPFVDPLLTGKPVKSQG